MPCLARFTRSETRLPFRDGKHWFHMEEVCWAECEGTVCTKCSNKLGDTYKYHESRLFDHGLVNEPYTAGSHMFESAWYFEKIKTYGEPTEETKEIAMRAQRAARAKAGVTTLSGTPESAKKAPPKRILRKKDAAPATPAPSAASTKEQPKRPLLCYETSDDPLPVKHIEVIELEQVSANGKTYWKNPETEQLFTWTSATEFGAECV